MILDKTLSTLENPIFENKFKFLEALFLFVSLTYDLTPVSLKALSLDSNIIEYFNQVTKIGYEKWVNDKAFVYGLAYTLLYYEDYIDQDFVNLIKENMRKAEPGNPLFDLYNGIIKINGLERALYFKLHIASNLKYIIFLKQYGLLSKYIIESHWNSKF